MRGADVMTCGHHSILLVLSRWRAISLVVVLEVVSRVHVDSSVWMEWGRSPWREEIAISCKSRHMEGKEGNGGLRL